MIISNVKGECIYEDRSKTAKSSLEAAAAMGADLAGLVMRKRKFSFAALDSLKARSGCFTCSDFSGADMADCDLRGADLRGCDFTDACLAGSDLADADLRGAVFHRTILDDCTLDGARVSCPGFLSCDLSAVRSIAGLVFIHRGETDYPLNRPPIVIHGLQKRLVIAESFVLYGTDMLCPRPHPLQTAMPPIPKSMS